MKNVKIIENLVKDKQQLDQEISKIIVGQNEVIDYLFTGLLCSGHILLEGVPGLAKTLLIKSLAETLDLNFNRIQFTPDLMPSDITGTEIIEEGNDGKRNFSFYKGPIFSNIILADEINRTPPKTQSALLQAMQEYKITSGGKTYDIESPFFVLATQNPIEQEGTYPLPEAQLDRFMFNLLIDYPSKEEEMNIVKNNTNINDNPIKISINKENLVQYQHIIKEVPVADNVIEYAVNFVSETRPNHTSQKLVKDMIDWGAGPRASSYLILGAKAHAVLNGNTTPEISDVHAMIKPVLRHRIIPNFNAETEGISKDAILEQLIDII